MSKKMGWTSWQRESWEKHARVIGLRDRVKDVDLELRVFRRALLDHFNRVPGRFTEKELRRLFDELSERVMREMANIVDELESSR